MNQTQQRRTLRLRAWLIGAAAVVSLTLVSHPALAAAPIHTVLDGQELHLDVDPVLENNRTLVPVRGILDPLGAKLQWDAATMTVTATLGTRTIKMVIGRDTAEVDGTSVKLDAPARIIENRTMIPVRFFAENLGMRVGWDGETRTVRIESRAGAATASRDGASANRNGALMAANAAKYVGYNYSWGGTSPDTGFDCSGLVYFLAKQLGVSLPRTASEMFSAGVAVSKEDLQAGDLVFYNTYGEGASHVGIYDGKGNFIHAESQEKGVTVTEFSREWWVVRYLGARRIFR